jgi:hypothetical protein
MIDLIRHSRKAEAAAHRIKVPDAEERALLDLLLSANRHRRNRGRPKSDRPDRGGSRSARGHRMSRRQRDKLIERNEFERLKRLTKFVAPVRESLDLYAALVPRGEHAKPIQTK